MATSERRSTGRGKDRRTSARAQTPAAAPAGPAVSADEATRQSQQGPGRPQLPPEEDRRREEIAKAAYYTAERRGFDGNRELDDWLEAEKEIDSRAAGAGTRHQESALSESLAESSASTGERAGGADGDIIEPPDLQKWAKKLNVPAPRLREAIQRVGPVASDVRRYLEAAGRPD